MLTVKGYNTGKHVSGQGKEVWVEGECYSNVQVPFVTVTDLGRHPSTSPTSDH